MHEIKRFTRARRERLTNWDKPHGARFILVGISDDGSEYAVSVIRRRQKRRYIKICKRINRTEQF